MNDDLACALDADSSLPMRHELVSDAAGVVLQITSTHETDSCLLDDNRSNSAVGLDEVAADSAESLVSGERGY